MPMIVMPVVPVIRMDYNHNPRCRLSLRRCIKAGKHKQHRQSQQPSFHSQLHFILDAASPNVDQQSVRCRKLHARPSIDRLRRRIQTKLRGTQTHLRGVVFPDHLRLPYRTTPTCSIGQ
jgi:hypothetical protein